MANDFDKYEQRHRAWRDITVAQLSVTNNVLLTLSAGLMAFCFEQVALSDFHINTSESIDKPKLFFAVSIVLLGFSMIYGIGVLFSRLYDFRISRHLALTRQRVAKNKTTAGKTNSLPHHSSRDYCCVDRLHALAKILFCKLPFISYAEAENFNHKTKERFEELVKLSDILGTASWKWTKLQAGLFLLSSLLYLVHRLLL